MRFQVKLALVFLALVTVILAASTWITTRRLHHGIIAQMGEKLLGVAITTALMIDADRHSELALQGSGSHPEYVRLKRMLRKVKEANASVAIENIYTMVKTDDPDVFRFIVDVDESSDRAGFGELFDVSGLPEMRLAFNGPLADRKTTHDKWGTWLSAYAPVRDAHGDPVAIVCVDAPAGVVRDLQWGVVRRNIALLGAVVLFSFPLAWLVSGYLTKPVKLLIGATEKIGQGDLNAAVPESRGDEFGRLGRSLNSMVKGLRERDYVKNTLSRYVTQEIADKVLSSPERFLSPERRQISVLFTDLRGFTTLSESMRPDTVLETLNNHFAILIDALFEYGGTLDKFLGDGLMAVFGAPVQHGDDAERCVRAALRMQERMGHLNHSRRAKGLPELLVGIGIHSGLAVAGNVGSEKRLEYTVIGDTVNLAARLQAIAEGGRIVISRSTYEMVKDIAVCVSMGTTEVKGRREPVDIYEVRSAQPA